MLYRCAVLFQATETHSPLVVETTNETNVCAVLVLPGVFLHGYNADGYLSRAPQVKIYTKLGFTAVGDIDITSDHGTAHMWQLVKRPAPEAAA